MTTNGPLMACPYCGAEAVMETMQVRKGFEADIQCTACPATMHSITYDDVETAVCRLTAAWNRRTVTPSVQKDSTIANGYEKNHR